MKDYNEFWQALNDSHAKHPSVRFRNHLIVRAVRRILGPQDNTIVDVGCGNGDLLKELNDCLRVNGTKVSLSGYDISEYQIEKNRRQEPRFDFRVADFNEKAEINNQFSIVISSELIEHLKNWKLALANMANMNKPGGYLILTTQSGKKFKSDEALGHIQHFELGYLADYLKTLNYEVIRGEKRGFPFYNLQKVVNSVFFTASTRVTHAQIGVLSSILFSITYFLFRINIKSKRLGPQIFILARKLS